MQPKRILEYPSLPLESIRYGKEMPPLPVISLLTQLNNLLTSWMLTTTLQKLEVLECENDSSSRCIAIGMKLKGWVDPELLRHRMNTFVHSWSKHLPIADLKGEDDLASVVIPHWSFVDLKGFAASEQIDRMQQHTTRDTLHHLALVANDQIHIFVFRLQSDTHMFHAVMRQRIPTTSSVKLLHELLDILHTQRAKKPQPEAISPKYDPSTLGAQSLTLREIEILRYISDGLSNRDIAQKCCIAEGTVKRHINNIYVKLDVGSRTQAVARAQSLDLLSFAY